MKTNVKTAIVTTLVNADHVLDTFIRYHLRIGFHRIYLFFDDADDRCIHQANAFPQVTAIPCTESFKERWKTTRLYKQYPQYHDFIAVEPMARQMLNMEIACEIAKQDDIDWILHIDIDELFYSPNETVQEHFNNLSKNRIRSAKYLNYEAVPEKTEIKNYFTEVTLFKKNPGYNTFFERRRYKKYNKNLFNYYINGKMAAEVRQIAMPGIHDFIVEEPEKKLPEKIQRYVRSAVQRCRKIWQQHPLNHPIILHYPVCGFENFWDKYVRLGNFNDRYFGVGYIPHPIHFSAKEAVISKNDKAKALQVYEHQVMLKEKDVIELIDIGLLFRIPDVAKMMGQK